MNWRNPNYLPSAESQVVAIGHGYVLTGTYDPDFEMGSAVYDGGGFLLWGHVRWWMPAAEFLESVEESMR